MPATFHSYRDLVAIPDRLHFYDDFPCNQRRSYCVLVAVFSCDKIVKTYIYLKKIALGRLLG